MKVLGIHHVAFAHQAGTQPADVLSSLLGLSVVHTEAADDLVERMIDTGRGYLQTVEAIGDKGTLKRFTDRHGSRLHHVALQVDDVSSAVAELIERDVEMVDHEPRAGGAGTRIAFIHPKETAGLLVELVEVVPN